MQETEEYYVIFLGGMCFYCAGIPWMRSKSKDNKAKDFQQKINIKKRSISKNNL